MNVSIISKMYQDIRQLCYPAPLRISDPSPNSLSAKEVESVLDQLKKIEEKNRDAEQPVQNHAEKGNAGDDTFMGDLATRLWRIRAALLEPGSDTPYKEASRSFRYLERLVDMLEKQGVRIVDKTGDFYDSGMMMEVVASEPMKGIPRDIIKETLEPMVLKEDRVIQTAKVVIGIPDEKGENNVE